MTNQLENSEKILITGASGFIGSFLVEKALERRMTVWAAVRKNSSRKFLTDPRIHFIELNFENNEALRKQLAAHREKHGEWDYVIHAAGATKCRNNDDFFRINTEGTLRLANLLLEEKVLTSGRFVFISSLSVMGAVREEMLPHSSAKWHYSPILETDLPRPNTAYGISKLQAELGLSSIEGLNYVILRPTGVYGPRERDYFLMAKSIASHVDFSVGFKPQELTFIYAEDLANAALNATHLGEKGKAYFLTDGEVYDSRTFSDLLQKEMGVRMVFHIKAPLWVLKAVSIVAEKLAKFTKKPSTLNTDKYKIMKQRNWQCDISSARRDLNYKPLFTLPKGVASAVKWYKEEKWL